MADYFVRIDDGKALRKEVLESSKFCIQILKQEHDVVRLRKQKLALIGQVRTDLKELTFLMGTLEKQLPILTKKELNELTPGGLPKKKVAKKATKAGKAAPEDDGRPLSKLERLERSLNLIETRLNEL